jgi:recombination protein RecA
VKEQAQQPDTAARQRAIDAALSQMDKQFGKGTVLRLGSRNVLPVMVIPSGSISLDGALGVGGFPRGRVIELFGPESSGKTTLALHGIAQAQKGGGAAAFIDAEHALDPGYARKLGVDVDNLIVSQPDCGEQALEITNALVASGGIDIIVIDSVAAPVPKAELEGEMGDSHMGLHARLVSQAMRKLTGVVGPDQYTAGLHQSGEGEDRRHVRQSGNHHRRTRAEVLFLSTRGGAAHGSHKGWRESSWQPIQD